MKKWKPKEGEHFYLIISDHKDSGFKVIFSVFRGYHWQKFAISQGNAFEFRNHAILKLKAIRKILKDA